MSVNSPAVGIDHTTVIPTNFDGDDDAETSSGVSTDGSVESATEP